MKAEVSGEIILIIAVLLSVSMLLLQVQQLANYQIAVSKEAMTKSIAKDIVSIIDGMGSVTGNITYNYEPPKMWYSLNITDGFVFAKGKDGGISSVSYTYDCVIPNSIENEAEIIIKKMDGCIYVGTFEKCQTSSDCESGYCWSSEKDKGFICHDECAGHMNYAPDSDACCPGKGWDQVTSLCYDEAGCSGYRSQCNSTIGCCLGLSCVNAIGASNQGHCCMKGWKWNGTDCERPPITYGILIIPINWDNKLNYGAAADHIGNYYLERLPLADCPGQFEVLKADLSTNYGSHWTNGYCDVSDYEHTGLDSCYDNPNDVLSRIAGCGNEYLSSTGMDFDFVVGIDDDDIGVYDSINDLCGSSVGGWSDGLGNTPAVIAEATNIIVASGITTHELGHEFGLMEQYCDCTGTAIENFCTTKNVILNPLKYNLGCGGVADGRCYHGFAKPIAFGISCPEVEGKYDMKSKDINSNPMPNANRTAMSNKILSQQQQGYYSIEEFNIIKGDSRMVCLP